MDGDQGSPSFLALSGIPEFLHFLKKKKKSTKAIHMRIIVTMCVRVRGGDDGGEGRLIRGTSRDQLTKKDS